MSDNVTSTDSISNVPKIGVVGMVRAPWSPKRAFASVEDVARYGWPLAMLLALFALAGYATVQTGLIERDVEQRVQKRIAAVDEAQAHLGDRAALRDAYAEQRKAGEFERTILNMVAVIAAPLGLLATLLIIAAVLFAVVALTGHKAEWHTLMTIVVYAAAVDALALIVRFALMMHFQTLEVHTSLAPLVRLSFSDSGMQPQALGALMGLATAIDPFRVWFWILVVMGLRVTRQLMGWRAVLICTACWMFGALINVVAMAAAAGNGGA